MKRLYFLVVLFISCPALAQTGNLSGYVTANGKPAEFVTVQLANSATGTHTDEKGRYKLASLQAGRYEVLFSFIGFTTERRQVEVTDGNTLLNIDLKETNATLNELVVTGVTRATSLRRNPVPIAIITRKEMEAHVNNNIIDAIVKGVPGVTAVTTGPNISKPFIRGLGYNRVLTMYDGIRQEGQQWGDEHGIEVDQYGVERAEVVKGPASLIYGSDATAGVINMIPWTPKVNDRLVGDAVLDYHTNNGMVGSSVGLGYRKAGGYATFRASGKVAHDYANNTDGLVYNTGYREYNIAGSAGMDKAWGFAHFTLTAYDNLQEIPDGSRDSATRQFTRQVSEADKDDIKNRPIVTNDDLHAYTLTALHQHIQHYRAYMHSLFRLGQPGDLHLSLGVQQSVRREYNHPTLPAQAGLYVVLNTANYDLKYDLPTWKGIETTIGINGMYQANASKAATDFPIPDYKLFDVGAFFFAKKNLGKLEVSGGVRYDNRFVNWADFYVGTDAATGFGTHAADSSRGKLQFPSFSHHYTGISGSVGATYSLSSNWILKANIARGYRAPNITETGSNGLDPGAHIVYQGNRDFKPEFTLQEDIGVIATLKDISISVELFNNNIGNYIYQSRAFDELGNPLVIVPGNVTYKYQQAEARIYGGEVSVNLHPAQLKWLSISNGLAYVTGLNKSNALAEKYGDAAKYLPFIPPIHNQTELGLNRQKAIGRCSKIYLRAGVDVYAAQHHYYAADNTETATSGYTLVHAGCGTTLTSKAGKDLCSLYLQADNITDVTYQSNLSRLKYFEYYSASPNGKTGIYNMGRNVSMKVIVPF